MSALVPALPNWLSSFLTGATAPFVSSKHKALSVCKCSVHTYSLSKKKTCKQGAEEGISEHSIRNT